MVIMPILSFDQLPDDARAWVFAASAPLSTDAEALLLREVDAFLAQWRAHGVPLDGARTLRDARFLCIGVHPRGTDASGCSVDGLFRTLRALEPSLGTTLLGGGLVFWRDDEGVGRSAPRGTFATHAAAGLVRGDTPVFDPAVNTVRAWRHEFERPAGTSWHAKWLT